jgi:hypothetical protein
MIEDVHPFEPAIAQSRDLRFLPAAQQTTDALQPEVGDLAEERSRFGALRGDRSFG